MDYINDSFKGVEELFTAFSDATGGQITKPGRTQLCGPQNQLSLRTECGLAASGNVEATANRIADFLKAANQTLASQSDFNSPRSDGAAIAFWSEAQAYHNNNEGAVIHIRPDQIKPLIEFFKSNKLQM